MAWINWRRTHYAPTAKADSVRIITSVAGAEDLELVQFDIKTAYDLSIC